MCGPNYVNLNRYIINGSKNMKNTEKETPKETPKETSCGYLKTEKEKAIYINMQNRV